MGNQLKVLVVDDDKSICRWLAAVLTTEGYECDTAESIEQAKLLLRQGPIDLALLDVYIGQANGLEFLEKLKTLQPECKCVVMSAHPSVEAVARSVAGGALEYLSKPLLIDELLALVRKLTSPRKTFTAASKDTFSPESTIVGRSPKMLEVYRAVARVAPSTAGVLITGASGSGKELVARAIHEHSPRRNMPFTPINCGSFPETILESELFGHEKGAFTGADSARSGLFEATNGGTLFLDEISETSLSFQVKLLRVVQEQKVRRVGSNAFTPIDVRIVAATNKDLNAMIRAGQFREDLYYRLSVVAGRSRWKWHVLPAERASRTTATSCESGSEPFPSWRPPLTRQLLVLNPKHFVSCLLIIAARLFQVRLRNRSPQYPRWSC